MPSIIYIEHNGIEHRVDVSVGDNLMQGAVNNAVPGIDADCGGACACATCHVYIDGEWFGHLSAADPMEQAMLECLPEPQANSRLACQIAVKDSHEGMRVNLPQHQGM